MYPATYRGHGFTAEANGISSDMQELNQTNEPLYHHNQHIGSNGAGAHHHAGVATKNGGVSKKETVTDTSPDLKLVPPGSKISSRGPEERKLLKKFKNLNKVKLNTKNNGLKSTQI